MLKKTLIGLVVLSVLAFVGRPAAAADPWEDLGDVYKLKAHSWPVEFKAVELGFKIPVKMDVGLYLEILNKKDVVNEGITLKQDGLEEYSGCSIAIEIQCNFPLVLGANIERTALGDLLQDDGGKWSTEIRDKDCIDPQPKVCKTLSGLSEKRTVFVKLLEAKIFDMDFGKDKHVADVILTVKPDWEPVWEDP